MSHHIKGQSRTQVTLFPEALDDFVTEDNPVRVIDAFVNGLDLTSLKFERVNAKLTGRPGYHPAAMLKLYIYGYLNRIQSSRRLEKETHRNVELMWLLERLQPDFKTIADFRKDNGKGIKNSCRIFVELCRQMNMFNDTIIAIDGSKFKAVNSKSNNFTTTKVKDRIARMEDTIADYLTKLDEADAEATSERETVQLKSKLEWLEKRLIELQQIKQDLDEQPDNQISLIDPDARLLMASNSKRTVGYNVQSAVDTKNHLIVSHDITTSTDRGQLTPISILVQKALRKKDINVIADKGYFSRVDIKAAQDLGITAIVPQTDTSGAKTKGIFNKSLFKYDKDRDIYTCPAGNELPHQRNAVDRGIEQKIYVNHIACRDCDIRAKCTQSKIEPRKMRRWIHEAEIDAMQERLDNAPETTVLRKQTVEHPFGTIKMWMGATHFLMKRKHNVATEMSLHVLAYNLKRMMSIVGVTGLISAIEAL